MILEQAPNTALGRMLLIRVLLCAGQYYYAVHTRAARIGDSCRKACVEALNFLTSHGLVCETHPVYLDAGAFLVALRACIQFWAARSTDLFNEPEQVLDFVVLHAVPPDMADCDDLVRLAGAAFLPESAWQVAPGPGLGSVGVGAGAGAPAPDADSDE